MAAEQEVFDPDRALALLEAVPASGLTESVGLLEARGRVLAEEVLSPLDSPPFAKAAMDGYAVPGGGEGDTYRLVETVAAGDVPGRALGPGECAKIMTGAMLPAGADKVVRVEHTEQEAGVVRVLIPEPHRNVIERGENLKAGERVLTSRVLRPQDIGILASLGRASVRVAVPPRVAVIATGSELADPGGELGPGQIYNSNGFQLCAQAASCGCPYAYYGVAPDEPQALGGMLGRAMEECEVVLLSGGVSMGDLDFVPDMVRRAGARVHFHKLSIKPGKPTLFAQKGDTYLFGLPGNPVSTFVIFEVFVKILLFRRMGITYRPPAVRARLGAAIRRREAGRLEFRPVRLEGGVAVPVVYHGSSHLNVLAGADGLIRIEAQQNELTEGSEVHVRLV